jgi:flagellar basal-body rod protein FlgB
LLVANIANADTPDYKPRDLRFSGILQALSSSGEQKSSMAAGKLILASTHPGHLQPSSTDNASLVEREQGEGKLDQNRVDLDYELTQLAENALLQETSTALLSRTLGNLRYAISEGRG